MMCLRNSVESYVIIPISQLFSSLVSQDVTFSWFSQVERSLSSAIDNSSQFPNNVINNAIAMLKNIFDLLLVRLQRSERTE